MGAASPLACPLRCSSSFFSLFLSGAKQIFRENGGEDDCGVGIGWYCLAWRLLVLRCTIKLLVRAVPPWLIKMTGEIKKFHNNDCLIIDQFKTVCEGWYFVEKETTAREIIEIHADILRDFGSVICAA